MPHFIIDCSGNVLDVLAPGRLMDAVYETAEDSGLFAAGDIKVRIRPYNYWRIGDGKNGFVHVFASIMQGRSAEQKAMLSRAVVGKLQELLPQLSIISMNVDDFEKSTYCNKAMLDPRNKDSDRFFKAGS